MTMDKASQEQRHPRVGERLRQAREVSGLSLNEIAEKQFLRSSVISAIEEGDYSKIDSELFLKGYVRAYANQVHIDPDSVIRQLDEELEPLRAEKKAKVEASPLVDIERRKYRKRRIARVIVVLLVVAAAFYIGSWYVEMKSSAAAPEGQDAGSVVSDDRDSPVAGDSGAAATEEFDRQQQAPAVPVEEPDPAAISSLAMAEQMDTAPDSDAMTAPADSGADAPEPATVESPEVGETGLSPSVTEPTLAASEPASDVLPDVEPAEPEQGTETALAEPVADSAPVLSETDKGRLVVSFSGDCWVEVTNADGRTLVADLRRAGETLEVTGDSPLRVVLGAVSSVSEVTFSGEPVDLSTRRASNNRLVLNLSE